MDYRQIRSEARQHLSGRWALAIGVAALAWLLGGAIAGSSFLPEITYTFHGEITNFWDALDALTTLSSRFGGTTIRVGMLALAQFLIGGAVQLGYAEILLKQHARQEYAVADLFSQFHRFGQGFAQAFLRELYSLLWGLLFIIPGIIARLSYAMTPFLMAEHPEMTAAEAISRSKELMYGHKWELFVLRLTFIGWSILAALTMNVGNLVLNPYKNAAEASFYRTLCPGRYME